MTQEMAKLAHSLNLEKLEGEFRRQQKILEEEADVAIAKMWLKVKEEKRRQKREDLAERAKIVKDLDIKSLIATIDAEGKREQLLEMFREQEKTGRSVEELLAMEAGRSPEAARALVEMARISREDMEKEFKERKILSDENADRLERLMTKALETTSDAAKHPGNTYINRV